MKYVLDENFPRSLTIFLQELGFKVEHVIDVGLRGHADEEIAAYAKEHQAVLVTKDLELANTLQYPKGTHYGLLVLRLPNYFTTDQIKRHLKEFLTKNKPEMCIGAIVILELGRFRTRDFS